ncbi:MAG: tetratricopeptide repeat protein, partial [Calditrichales bacterium]
EYHYSLGVCEYNLKQYENAKTHFNRAIEIEDFADAYLYIGAIYRLEGNLEKSLYYYRERVKRKSGDDDRYAREAMKGIRLILNDMAEAEEKAQSDENKNSPN